MSSKHPSLELLKEAKPSRPTLPEQEGTIQKVMAKEIVDEQNKTVQETQLFIEELKQSLKIQKSQITEIKRLLETEQIDIDALLKEALQLLIHRLK